MASLRDQLRQKNNIQQANMNHPKIEAKAETLIDVIKEDKVEVVQSKPTVSSSSGRQTMNGADLFPTKKVKTKRDKNAKSIYFSDELYDRIKVYAQSKNWTTSEVINNICQWYMDEVAIYEK